MHWGVILHFSTFYSAMVECARLFSWINVHNDTIRRMGMYGTVWTIPVLNKSFAAVNTATVASKMTIAVVN